MTTTSQAVAQRDDGPTGLIEKYRADFATVLPAHIKSDQWVRLCVGVVRRNPQLAQVAQKNPGSFLSALLDCARLGLEPGDTYHLVPFGNEVTGIVDYKGEIELIYRAGAVASVQAEAVYSNDEFEWSPGQVDLQHPPRWSGPQVQPYHRVDWFAPRGDLIGVYAYAVMKDGSLSRVVVMGAEEISRHAAMSRGSNQASSPWKKWPKSMWLKTSIHELKKWVPTSAEYRNFVMPATEAVELVSHSMAEQLPVTSPGRPAHVDDEGVIDADIDDAEIVEDEPAGGALLDELRSLMAAAGRNEAQVVVLARRLAPSVGVEAPMSFADLTGPLLDALIVELGGGPFDDDPTDGAPAPDGDGPEASGPDGSEVVPDDDVELVDGGEEQAAVVGGGASIDRQEVGASAPAAAGGNTSSHHHRMFFARAPRIAHHHGQTSESFRRILVGIYTKGETTSATGFSDDQWAALCELVDRLDPERGGEELYVKPSGVWTIRKPRSNRGAAA